jgi:hypothetical protein
VFEIAEATGPRNDRGSVHVLERHVQDAFLEVLLTLSRGRELFTFFMEPRVNAGGPRKYSDILIELTGPRRLLVFEIGISENRDVHTTPLRAELTQMLRDKHLVVGPRAAGAELDAFAAIFTRDGQLRCAAGPFRGRVVEGTSDDGRAELAAAIDNLASLNVDEVRGYRAWPQAG